MGLRQYSVQLPAQVVVVAVVMNVLAKLEVRAVVVVLAAAILRAEQQHQPDRAMQAAQAVIILIRTPVVAGVVLEQQVEQQLVALRQVTVALDYRHLYQVVRHTTQVEAAVVLDMPQLA